MNTECNPKQLHFQGLGSREVVGCFDGGTITSDAGILSIVVDEKKHIPRRTSYAASSSKTPSTNFRPARTSGMIEDPVSRLQFF